MKNIKTIISLVLVMAMMAGVALAAEYSHESEIIIKGKDNVDFTIADTALTETDLFDNFKNVMPGDKLQEKIVVKNEVTDHDYITLTLRHELHDEEENPLKAETDETVESMHDFLSQLTMRIYDENADHKLVFQSPVNGEPSDLISGYSLGVLPKGQQYEFIVELEVPAEMGNEYANRLGEVDWVFTYSADNYPEDEPTTSKPTTAPTTNPTEPTTGPVEPTEPTEDIEDPDVPLTPVDPSSPDTGDHSNMLPYIVMFIIGLMGLILTSKKRKTN